MFTRDGVKYVFVFVFTNTTQKWKFAFVFENVKGCIFVFEFVFEPFSCHICFKYSQIH